MAFSRPPLYSEPFYWLRLFLFSPVSVSYHAVTTRSSAFLRWTQQGYAEFLLRSWGREGGALSTKAWVRTPEAACCALAPGLWGTRKPWAESLLRASRVGGQPAHPPFSPQQQEKKRTPKMPKPKFAGEVGYSWKAASISPV